MNKIDLDYFYEKYQVFYQSVAKESASGETEFLIIKTRLPNESMALLMSSEEQAKKLLIEKEQIKIIEKRKNLNEDIVKSKKSFMKTAIYHVLPFLNKRFYNEVAISGTVKEENKLIEKINSLTVVDNEMSMELNKYSFNFLRLNKPACFYLVVKESNNEKIMKGMHKLSTSNIYYIIDHNAKQIRIAFKGFLNEVEIKGEEQRDGSFIIKSDTETDSVLYSDFSKARASWACNMEEKIEDLKVILNNTKKELRDLQNRVIEVKKIKENEF